MALLQHLAIDKVQLVGSRARGDPTPFSDWDFEVTTHQFPLVARALPSLTRPLRPLAQQWDRLSRHHTYTLVLEGPEKVDRLFGGSHEKEKPWTVSEKTLPAIDDHLWDWMLWLFSKDAAGRSEVIKVELERLFTHLLEPMGVRQHPVGIDEAMKAYVEARAIKERVHHVRVSRRLEHEVLKAFMQLRRPQQGDPSVNPLGPDLRDPARGPLPRAMGNDRATSSIEIRLAEREDVEVAAEILEDAIAWARHRGFDSWAPGDFTDPEGGGRQRLLQAMEAGGLYLMLVEGQAVGTMSLLPEDPVFWPGSPPIALYLHLFAIRGSQTRRGVGAAALAWAAREVLGRGRRLLRLDCLADNRGIRAYYERAGFEHRGDVEVKGMRFSLYELEVGWAESYDSDEF